MKSSLNTKFKALLVVAGLASAFGAHASTNIIFDPTGTPGPAGDLVVGAFDQSPGNALAIGASAGSVVGTSFNLTYQANLGSLINPNGQAFFLNGTGGNYFTFVAGFNEVIISNSINASGVGTLQFGFGASNSNIPSATNFFYMYATTTPGTDLTGVGFVPLNSTPILTGHFVATNYVSAFTANGLGATPTPLDGFGGINNYVGTSTIIGAGSTVATLVIDGFNVNYFPSLVVGATSSLINTSQNLAFNQTDPAALMTLDGVGATTPGVGSVGPINGISGRNTIFQADANQSFNVAAVPEPLPAALIGLGLVALGLARRRKAAR